MRKPFERFLSHRPLMFGTEVMRACLHLLLPKIFLSIAARAGPKQDPKAEPL